MAYVSDIRLAFNFSNCSNDSKNIKGSFITAYSDLKSIVEDWRDTMLDQLNDDGDDEWEFDEWVVADYDSDYADPDDFDDLNAYGEYCENIEEFGEAFHLRYEDLGEITKTEFQDSYNGCWSDAEEFVQNMLEDLGDIEVPSYIYIDWERTTYDIMMDYSEYDGSDGTHIFRDC